MNLKNQHLYFGFFALMLTGSHMLVVLAGSLGTPGLFASVLSFDPAKLISEQSQNLGLWEPPVHHDAANKAASLWVDVGRNPEDAMTIFYDRDGLVKDGSDVEVTLTFKNGSKTVDKVYYDQGKTGAFDVKNAWGSKANLVAVKVNDGLLVLQPEFYHPNTGNNSL